MFPSKGRLREYVDGRRDQALEGRVKSTPEKITVVEKTLQLREKLVSAGFEVEHLDDAIRAAEMQTALELERIFGGRYKVRVNDEIYVRQEPTWDLPTPPLQLDASRVELPSSAVTPGPAGLLPGPKTRPTDT